MTELKVFNAPAGSGKTTTIRGLVESWSIERPLDKMLCITFTNRAADELTAGISSNNVEISTIHSFLARFAKRLFSSPEVVELYLEVYRNDIEARIENVSAKETIRSSNERYELEFGAPLSFDLIAQSIHSLYYNETSFNSLYRGGLSHDDLLSFICRCADEFPSIYRRVSSKYALIIIDEYQDTNVDVLDFFVKAVEDSNSALHLYGDAMQQIYPSDLVRFRETLKRFDTSQEIVKNYRSTQSIVNVLNHIYNDKSLVQQAASSADSSAPRAYITSSPDAVMKRIQTESSLVLTIYNSTIFAELNSSELFNAVQNMPEHGAASRYPAVGVLRESRWEDVKDPVIQLLYGLLAMQGLFSKGVYGKVIQMFRRYPAVFGKILVSEHSDKERIKSGLEVLFRTMGEEDVDVGAIVRRMGELSFLEPVDVSDIMSHEDYSALLNVPFRQVARVYDFNQNPTLSTQHGVKGESHDRVILVVETSRRTPVVHMDSLFRIWPTSDINLAILEDFAANLLATFQTAIANVGANPSKMKKADYEGCESKILGEATEIYRRFSTNSIFAALYKDSYEKYFGKRNVTNAKLLFRTSPIDGLLAAYRLFYVGCSRARSQLDVVIRSADIDEVDVLKGKLEEIGFEVLLDEDNLDHK